MNAEDADRSRAEWTSPAGEVLEVVLTRHAEAVIPIPPGVDPNEIPWRGDKWLLELFKDGERCSQVELPGDFDDITAADLPEPVLLSAYARWKGAAV
jgi:hypothetical protein